MIQMIQQCNDLCLKFYYIFLWDFVIAVGFFLINKNPYQIFQIGLHFNS